MNNRETGLVSVIIPVFNGERFLRDALASVFAQTYEKVEIIVVDDGSTDKTPDLLAACAGRVRAIRQERGGPSLARNRGLDAAAGQFVQFLDADDLLLPNKIERQVAYLAAHPDAGAVYCEGRYFCDSRPGWRLTLGQVWFPEGDIFGPLTERNFILTHSALVRHECLDRFGAFRPEVRRCEDWDLWLRLARNGVRFGFLPDVVVDARIHPASASIDRPKMFEARARVLETVWRDLEGAPRLEADGIARHLADAWYLAGRAFLAAGRAAEGRAAARRSIAAEPDFAKALGKHLHIVLSYVLPRDASDLIVHGLHQFYRALLACGGRSPVRDFTCRGAQAPSDACKTCPAAGAEARDEIGDMH